MVVTTQRAVEIMVNSRHRFCSLVNRPARAMLAANDKAYPASILADNQ